MSVRVQCTPAFLGNNLMSEVCTGKKREREGDRERDLRAIYQNKMPNDTENGKNRRRKQMKRAKSEKYCAAEFVSVIEEREWEGGWEREGQRQTVAWVSESKVNWLAHPLQHSTASTAARNKQMLQLLVLPLAIHSHYPTLAAASSARGPCKHRSGIVPQCQHSFRATCHDVVASIFMLYWPTLCQQLGCVILSPHWIYHYLHRSTCTCNAITYLINQIAASYANLALCGGLAGEHVAYA